MIVRARHDDLHASDKIGTRRCPALGALRMKIVNWDVLVDNDYSDTPEFAIVDAHICDGIDRIKWPPGIDRIKWPPGNDKFVINPESGKKRGEGNGVKPIKDAFTEHLVHEGWTLERERFDAHYEFESDSSLPFVVEWETGNISSSHRSVNRIALNMTLEQISGGVVIVPSGELKPYLTDRVGNRPELVSYFPLWRLWGALAEFRSSYLAIVTVEHDATSWDVPRIGKGTDGRALL